MNMIIFEEWNLGSYLQATERRAEGSQLQLKPAIRQANIRQYFTKSHSFRL